MIKLKSKRKEQRYNMFRSLGVQGKNAHKGYKTFIFLFIITITKPPLYISVIDMCRYNNKGNHTHQLR